MEQNWGDLDVETLRDVYEKESAHLKASLLSGSSWEALKDQRKRAAIAGSPILHAMRRLTSPAHGSSCTSCQSRKDKDHCDLPSAASV